MAGLIDDTTAIATTPVDLTDDLPADLPVNLADNPSDDLTGSLTEEDDGHQDPLGFADDYADSPADDIPETMAEFVLGLAERLSQLGYLLPSWLPAAFFDAVGHAGGQPVVQDGNLMAYEPLLATLVAKGADERRRFHRDYAAYVRNRRDVVASPSQAATLRRQMENERALSARMGKNDDDIRKKEREIARKEQREREMQEAGDGDGQQPKPKPLAGKRKTDSLRKRLEELSDAFDKAFASARHKDLIKTVPDMLSGEAEVPDAPTLEAMARDLQTGMRMALLTRDPKGMMELVSQLSDCIKKMQSMRRAEERKVAERATPEKTLDQMQAELSRLREQRAEMEERQHQFADELARRLREMSSPDAGDGEARRSGGKSHRPEFLRMGNRARWSDSEGEAILDRRFASLTQGERDLIHSYIAENAVRFKTRMARNLRTRNKRQVDMPETCRRACATAGIPMDLRFLRDRRQRARLLMFLDVSGSCKEASDLMLTFMYQMADVFPGGCKAYAFVRSLYDVSGMFEEAVDARSAVREVLATVPTRGVYSDYHAPFDDFRRNRMHEVTRDTIVFFIGDARNNRNPTGADNVKAIARRAKRAYWLNTEAKAEWDTGDSVMWAYSPYMTQVAEVLTPGDLIGFLTEVR